VLLNVFYVFLFCLYVITYIILNMDLITKMERVYMPGTTRFGNIVKKGGLFGIKDSFSVIDDTGKKQIFLGKNIGDFVYVETSENCNGEKCNEGVPVDGYQIIKNEYPRCTKYISTYYDMSLEERNDLMVRWKKMKKSQKDAIVKKK